MTFRLGYPCFVFGCPRAAGRGRRIARSMSVIFRELVAGIPDCIHRDTLKRTQAAGYIRGESLLSVTITADEGG